MTHFIALSILATARVLEFTQCGYIYVILCGLTLKINYE